MTFSASPFGHPPGQSDDSNYPAYIARALEAVQKILDNNKVCVSPDVQDHQYEDKYALVEFLTNTGIAAILNVLDQFDGFNQEILKEIIAVVQDQKRSMTLRFAVEEDCEFVQETNRIVESPSIQSTTTETDGSSPGTNKTTTHKVMREVKEFHWKCGIRSTLMLFAGTDSQHGIVLGTRTGTTNLVTTMKKHPFPPQTRQPLDLDLTWMVKQLQKDTLTCSFQIDREEAKTPRRNEQTEECLRFLNNANRWKGQVLTYLRSTIQHELLRGQEQACPPAQWLSQIQANEIFQPVAPLFQEYTKEEIEESIHVEQSGLVRLPPTPTTSPVIPLKDTTLFLKEQYRSIQACTISLMANFPDPADPGQLVSGYEAKLVLLFLHIQEVVYAWMKGINHVERMLHNQLVSAVGKEVQAEDFNSFLKFHNQRIFGKNFSPKPFCHAIRQPNQYPDGVLSIVNKTNSWVFGKDTSKRDGDAIHTFSKHIPGDSLITPISIPLNAATTVEFLGDQYLHGWVDTEFSGEQSVEHSIIARARQFSCFLLLLGTVSGPNEFTPKDAIILQNKDEVLIPLLTQTLPSAKEFRDAIQSLSPEQARFAKSFRSMQLDSSVFGVCVIQVKPQLEALLQLPPNALTKEIQLTQDLLSLFVDYQIPPNLISYDGDEGATVAEKVIAVKEHTKGVLDVIKGIKDAQLAEETKKADMRAEQNRRERDRRHLESSMRKELCRGERDQKEIQRAQNVIAKASEIRALFGAPAPVASQSFGMGPMERSSQMAMSTPRPAASVAEASSAPPHVRGGRRPAALEYATAATEEVLEFDEVGFDDLHEQFGDIDLKKQDEDTKKQHDEGWGVAQPDFTAIPKTLDRMFEKFDKDGALRTMTVKTGDNWMRTRQENLLTKMRTSEMSDDEKKNESNKALDLLDALSRSGSLAVSSGELHVVIGVRHSFEKNVMATVIQESVNPIERVDYSSLLVAASVHRVSIPKLIADSTERPSLVLKSREFPELMIGSQAENEAVDEDDPRGRLSL